MHRQLLYGILGCLAWVGVLALAVALLTAGAPANPHYFQGASPISYTLYAAVAVVFFLCFARIYPRYRERDILITGLLALALLFQAIALVFQALFNPFKVGIEMWDVFGNEVSYVFLGFSFVYFTYFVFEIFHQGLHAGKNYRKFLVIMAIIFAFLLYISYDVLFLPGPELSDLLTYVFALPFVTAVCYVFVLMSKSAFSAARKLPAGESRRSFQYIGLAGVFFILGFLFVFLFNIVSEATEVYEPSPQEVINVLALIFTAVGSVLNYRGYVMPRDAKSREVAG